MNSMLSKYIFISSIIFNFFDYSVYGQEPKLEIRQVSEEGAAVLLEFKENTFDWVAFETSSDLVNWERLSNVRHTKGDHFPYFHFPQQESTHLFYRAIVPGTTISNAWEKWVEHKPKKYKYTYKRWLDRNLGSSGILQGIVLVDFEEIQLLDVTWEGTPISDYNEADFLKIDELFSFLIRLETTNPNIMEISYDKRYFFPDIVGVTPNEIDLDGEIIKIENFELIE